MNKLNQHLKTNLTKIADERWEVGKQPPRSYGYREKYFRAFKKTPGHWDVHHIDHDRSNSDLRNLIALPPDLHRWIHSVQHIDERIYSRTYLEELLGFHQQFFIKVPIA